MIQLGNEALRARINPLGAELSSVRGADGEERIWQGDPAVWSGRAPVLFPVAGSFLGDSYTYRGQSYAMPQHGFARNMTFRTARKGATWVSLILDEKQPNYPFDYRFTAEFALLEDTPRLRVTYKVENTGADDMYFGLGAHEGFACPKGIEAYQVHFPSDDTLRRSLLQGSQLSGETEGMRLHEGALALSGKLFVNDALVFLSLKSRAVTLKSPLDKHFVRVDFPDFDNLLLWQKPGAKYLCIEPWINPPERLDHDGDITRKPGAYRLPAGQVRAFSHTITFG